MHVNILILIIYISNYQASTPFYENMRNISDKKVEKCLP